MTDYADLKVSPILRDLMLDAAAEVYDQPHGAISRMGHEAGIAWLATRVDDPIVQKALAENGFDDIQDVIDALTDPDRDGRFQNDPDFDPLAAIETPRDLDGDVDG